ncbi:glutamyl endopeptidase, partial [Lecanoromycetidae sp. Uapishka_2]
MAIIKTAVAKSNNTKDAALNLNVKAYEVRRTLAAVWDLEPTPAQPPSPESAFSLDMKNESSESVVGDADERTLVEKLHFGSGGKYRSIVKLFIHYEFQAPGSWAMGTGWLIKPDILVTAGHCSYDWNHKLGRATEVKAYIGYDGHQSEKDPNVQFRQVKRIVTTEGWVKTKGQKSFDVSFMQVKAPFTGITPVKFEETPSQGSLILGVVGYPGDLSDKRTGEKGAHMYEMFLPTDFDLSTQADTMLEYQIDTYGGNSGSPVLRQHDLVSIGAHVYGGSFNSASVIGKYGNPYQDYIAAFGLPLPNNALNLIPVTGNTAISAPVPSGYGSSTPGSMNVIGPVNTRLASQVQHGPLAQARSQPQRTSTVTKRTQNGGVAQDRKQIVNKQMTESEEEGFMDVLKTVASALPTGLGLIGGGPIGALAGFALNAASKFVAETSTAESAMDTPAFHEGSMERAILAEATLSALQSAEMHPDLEESIFSDIKDTVMKALPVIRKAAPHVMGAMMEPALKIAIDSLHNYNQKVASGAESFEATSSEPFRPTVQYTSAIDQPADHETEDFLGQLQTSLQQNLQESAMDGDSEEGFIDIIKAGARLASKGVLAAAEHGLPLLVDVLKQAGGAEAFEDQPSSVSSADLLAADPLAQRALVADAALKAIMKLPPQQLQEEGFFDFVTDAVKTIAPIAMKFAPVVAGAINPTIGKLVSTVLGQESALAGTSTTTGPTRPRLAATRGISTKRSLHSLRVGNAHDNEGRSRSQLPGTSGYQSTGFSRLSS